MELQPTGIYISAVPPLPAEIDSPSSLGDEQQYDDTGFITGMDLQTQQFSSTEKEKKEMEMQKAYSSSQAGQGKDTRRMHVFLLYGLVVICFVMLVVLIVLFLGKYSEISQELKELHFNNSEMTMTVLKDLDDIRAKQDIIQKSVRNDFTDLQDITASICKKLSISHSSCPSKWTAKENACYYFSSGTRTWSESQSYCIEQRAYLVSVESDEEQVFLRNAITSRGTYWLGATDISQDGKWRWSEDDKLVTISFWDIGEPKKGYNKDCGIMYPNGSWAAAACSISYHWICKKHLIC
ncbi:C-type lectin domain family 17, member A-like isoform X1 [Sphaerodactylus townsendi]|uniref:C-type lectin domain family 17, member A-like isoform X1 n=2 Tax=Sphaerodactylus townsendi TaxID=933632 RepID=UPI002025FC4E|nr:C-type lectin domain family 17, member A-like isoform X1 [Sphaerodactylus townsendi]